MKNLLINGTALALLSVVSLGATYDEEVSKRLVYYSAAAFCKESTLTNWNCGAACTGAPGITNFKPMSDIDQKNFGYTGYNQKLNEIVVAYRGSHNLDNWISDINFVKTPYPNAPNTAQIHKGFYEAYQTLQTQTLNGVKALIASFPNAKIVVTGHSLGAALATFAALDIKTKLNPKTQILFYTYGSPRAGDQGFTDYLLTQFPGTGYHRVVHTNDIVPHVPIIIMGFNHGGNEVWYNTETTYVQCGNQAGKPENKGCADTRKDVSPASHKIYLGIPVTKSCDQVSLLEENSSFLA